MSFVLQKWLENVPWKQQSILLSGLRGPDSGHCPKIKEVTRWLRMISQNDADPSQSYMAPGRLPQPEEMEKELEFSTCHFAHHFSDALRVVALHCPDPEVARYARDLQFFVANEVFHFVPESDEVYLRRHRDRVEHL